MNRPDREFRLALTIKDEPSSPVQIAIVLGEDETGTALVGVVASGFAPDDTGAGMLADMLQDVADAINEHVGKERQHTPTEAIPVVKRPQFNPRPVGKQ